MTLKHINITEINLKLNMQDKNVGFYLDFSIEYVKPTRRSLHDSRRLRIAH